MCIEFWHSIFTTFNYIVCSTPSDVDCLLSQLIQWRANEKQVEIPEKEKTKFNSYLLDPDQVDSVDPDSNDTRISRAILTLKPTDVRIARAGGIIVAVKKAAAALMSLTPELIDEIQMIRKFEHPNLTELVGISVETSYVHFYWEYCPKASLGSIIRRMALPLNWTFRLSLLTDIANGLMFLHKHGIIHGRLSSNNCVVDGNWTCKITDCPDLMEVPEMDIYSFGTLMSEIALRTDFHKVSPANLSSAAPFSSLLDSVLHAFKRQGPIIQ
ncbi:unnamed protein product [Echinostoma caproni]|uniref:guanylate cyclase n=1 Tax=Echinostoma caproni TaxID=27848 RepID=A0A183APN2_9TREM|nr:unnamed protein product [Echinostoma caproni]